jgi:prepilin-type N-terminal cleavage/methylation domain-containing protein
MINTSHRSAFTLVEVTVVVAIMALLTGLVSPGIFRSLRQGSINGAASLVKTAAEDAQSRSMRAGADVFAGTSWGDGLKLRYGVRVTPATATAPATVTVLRGTEAIGVPQTISESVDLRQWSGAIPDSVADTTNLLLMTNAVEWWYDWHTGLPCKDPLGTPMSGNISFNVATRDYRIALDPITKSLDQRGMSSVVTIYRRTGVVRAQ